VSVLQSWIDAGIGEAREALVQDGVPIAFRVLRWSDEGRRARWGETYAARVVKIDPRRQGAFLDLGLSEEQGFLPLSAARPPELREGGLIAVDITREAARGKSPVARLRSAATDGPARRLAAFSGDLELMRAGRADHLTRDRLDALVEELQNPTAALPGGGAIVIEPTAALVAIDVDGQDRQGSRDAERFALELNLEAGRTALRQLRLRNLGGLIGIDFVHLRRHANRAALVDAIKAAAADDPWGLQLAGLSRFGILELSRGQLRRPLHEVLGLQVLRQGEGSPETAALAGLRRLRAEAVHAHGRALELRIAPPAAAWLNTDVIGWRAALEASIGVRWRVQPEPRFTGAQMEVIAQ
jgi:Ribonuclease G/E